ncbi:hypothetical protein BHM03_00060959 [Ensete ventricosum]|nr:hypothetical protein BHM03_00060959 [Ensete ventricosum]
MRLRLQCTELDKEAEELEIDPIDLQFYDEDSKSILEWVEVAENQEDPLLDEAGDHQRLSHFIIRVIEEEEVHPQQVANPPRSKRGKRKGEGNSINHTVGRNRVGRRNTFTIAFSNSLALET